MNRPLTTTDGGGGYVSYSYINNDVLQTIGPAASGEGLKQKQMEYDGLGRLISVCELTSGLAGNGACQQQSPAQNKYNGYYTTYAYGVSSVNSVNYPSVTITLNAQASAGSQQTRTYVYDLLGRLIQETNPENGTTTYTYDSANAGGCVLNHPGDLILRTDANGNWTCSDWDSMHRVLSIRQGHDSPNAAVTAERYFVYDGATVNGATMSNAKGRLARAYTSRFVINNPDFEASSSLPPPGWTAQYANLSYDTSTPYAGARSLIVSATALYGNAQTPMQAAVVGASYTISAWAKSDGTCSAYMQLNFLDSSGAWLGAAQAATGTSTSWTYATATSAAPAGTVNLNITLQNNTPGGAGSCEFDNISASTNIATTDEGFSYSARGDLTDVYQYTPNSGGYYHVSAGYWANGALQSLSSNISGLPNQNYGVDGMGRTNSVSASSGQNPVTSTSYNLSTFTNNVTFGSGDSDTFNLDPNTGRMLKYVFNVNGNTNTGQTTWNPNGSLGSLQITDNIPSTSDTQTCNYTHDDLGRIASVNCANGGTNVWNQNLTYDAFGNITKTVPTGGTGISFQPGYSSNSNWITSLPGCTPTTDANGQMTYDCTHNYSWDGVGDMVRVDGATITYDALGRMVENNFSGAFKQIVYSPLRSKFAVMNGQSLQQAFIPLPGAQAVYTGAGLAYYRHQDHLGSSHLATTPNRALYSSTAYGPFGEPYVQVGTADNSFTGIDQDTVPGVSGLYDFMFRRQSPVQGRWLSPDPAGLAAVDFQNPQTWNRYAYVSNRPLSRVDPNGLYYYDCSWNGDCLGLGRGSGAGYYGGGPGGCSLDDVQTACGNLTGLGSNGIAPCPNNFCAGFKNGVYTQYTVDANANGFYSCLTTGLFATQQQAGIAAVGCANGQSIYYNREYVGNIYKIDSTGQYSFTLGTAQGPTSGTVDFSDIPDATEFAGFYHTHGAFDINYFGEQFSGFVGDIGVAFSHGNQFFPTYLGTPAGRVEMFNPAQFGDFPNGCVLVGPPVIPGPGVSTVPVPVCP